MSSARSTKTHRFEALAIASSTGGPQALSALFKSLRGGISHVPVFITQHMPANFTTVLAETISRDAHMDCHEAKDGEMVKSGVIYLAPGDYHMLVEFSGKGPVLRLNQDPPVNFCRPAADPMFAALASFYKDRLLGVVLTGMGSDGLEGAKKIVAAGGTIIAQDEKTSVVWGMPKAVSDAKIAKAVLPLDQMGHYIVRALA
ncbi:MAG: chemotaxis protein CheB [Alphaproteobacteria bacterium]|nr:chemotaxis protein CheB [Alphaproteobacteria bacterium]